MKLAWVAPLWLRLLGLLSVSESGTNASALSIGFRITSHSGNSGGPHASLSPSFSLDPNFFIQLGSQELRLPIMPLHLLGKKSWNVYNHDNVERVKRDEAAARAKEEAEEQRMQEIDAARRMQILRGEEPTPILAIEDKPSDHDSVRERRPSGRDRKRRRYDENETDFEMRVASEQTQLNNEERQIVLRRPVKDVPLVDHAGHIDLFPQEPAKVSVEKNAEAEKEKAKKQKEYEDQYTMRFSNAAGFKQGLDNPWYSKASSGLDEDCMPVSKDVWGNEDPRRKEREAARAISNDPLAAMRQGAAQVRQVERERKRWREEKERELRELTEAEAEETRRKRKRRHDEDDLENFSLDATEKSSSKRRHRDDDDRERRHRHRESSRRSHAHDSHRHRHRDEERSHRHKHRHRSD
ncbi:hypothetical protein BP5796_09010 [Coleophoma crateriformis]|uniref:CBF1-interacting co-repressor CIR N-terminal domain-containing protein n=1 Tax=Coleophoma crateriformis TaxID=565419 RepID=A0A3D8R2T6_9HELO|nr:hypothetical protein BP5796_09010 [Coleophoma crateriformis]